MRRERWWWLAIALIVSFVIHLVIGWRSRVLDVSFVPPSRAGMEVTLEPPAKAAPRPKPREPKRLEPKVVARTPPVHRDRVRLTREVKAPRRSAPVRPAREIPVRTARIPELRPKSPKVDPGGIKIARLERPLLLGMTLPTQVVPQPTPEETPPSVSPSVPTPAVRLPERFLAMTNPLASEKAPDETPTITPQPVKVPRIMRMARADHSTAGGGTPSPSRTLGGHGGAAAPEAPPDDLLFNGGGAGGVKVPHVAPRIGGGGGNPILSVSNPLAAAAIPEERPGLGAGKGGGEGLGFAHGAGFGRGLGVGVSPNGKGILSTLRSKPGVGLGASLGSGRGTRLAGTGRGTGSELPGTGGLGLGYGRGSGLGVGNGFRPGVGSGSSVFTAGGSAGGVRMASNRGIPFGDITGLLQGGDKHGGAGRGGGPGGAGDGAETGGRSGGSGPLHVVYLLDVSGSMRYNDKIIKARAALAKALSELRRSDWFNIICFDRATYPFAASLQKATPANVQRAVSYINAIPLDADPGTDMSGVLDQALRLKKVSEIFLMSDGEPNGGIMDFNQLRADVRTRNPEGVPIYTLALGVGSQWKGIALMKGVAEDNHGQYHYIDLKGIPREGLAGHL